MRGMAEERPYVPWIAGAVAVVTLAGLGYAVWPDDGSDAASFADRPGAEPSAPSASGGGVLSGDGGVARRDGDPGLGLAWTASREARSTASERVAVQARPGGAAPSLTSDAVVPALRRVREHVARCVREKAGEDDDPDTTEGPTRRPSLGGADGGTGEPPMASFNIDESGRVVVRSFSLDAPASEELRTCYSEAFAEAEFPPPGEGGAFLRIGLE